MSYFCHGNLGGEKLDKLRCFCFFVVLIFVQLDFNGCFGCWRRQNSSLTTQSSMIKYIDENNFTSWDSSKNIMKWYWNQPKVKSLSQKCICKAIGCFLFPQWKYSFIKRGKKILLVPFLFSRKGCHCSGWKDTTMWSFRVCLTSAFSISF